MAVLLLPWTEHTKGSPYPPLLLAATQLPPFCLGRLGLELRRLLLLLLRFFLPFFLTFFFLELLLLLLLLLRFFLPFFLPFLCFELLLLTFRRLTVVTFRGL